MCLTKKNNLTWPKCKVQFNKKYLCNPLFTGWWANPATTDSTCIEICKKNST